MWGQVCRNFWDSYQSKCAAISETRMRARVPQSEALRLTSEQVCFDLRQSWRGVCTLCKYTDIAACVLRIWKVLEDSAWVVTVFCEFLLGWITATRKCPCISVAAWWRFSMLFRLEYQIFGRPRDQACVTSPYFYGVICARCSCAHRLIMSKSSSSLLSCLCKPFGTLK